ncbi:MAG: hypothetical protein OZSIB_3187 [Candidatus Ozemobacter sibiricus]|jgi:hypothetical protein|uniref:Uncharacterized protein n=1 Tax=Candidatus Ozemobacter sibiricus TaxID=2268124 RepID=A0A367ZSX1_9BACT|nr:MAG: hypothetical protein OZSIB_3187 [Candidatus Ozemobacter sibiricus]
MVHLNQLVIKFQMYWDIPGFRVGLGLALLTIGIVTILLPEGRQGLGILLTIVGLFALLHGASEIAGLSRRRPPPAPPPAAPAPPKSHSFMHIQVDPPPAGGK